MTEYSRIIQKNLLPYDFNKQELICDFLVNKQRKKIWAIELDLLAHINCICKKYKLRYVLAAGSLLGAVRHDGFIPWDDDIDIVMPREDYEKFIQLKDEFTFPYFLQLPCEDNGYYYAMARVRNCNTSAIDYPFVFQDFNQGMFIDVHPYDDVEYEKGREIFKQADYLIRKNSTAMRLTHPRLSEKDKIRIMEYDNSMPNNTYKELNELIQSFNGTNADYVAYFTATTYGYDRNVFKKEWFSERIPVKFQGIQTYIPCGYKEILEVEYGDYNTLPPMEKRGTWHGSVFFDPDIPYMDILNKIREDIVNGTCTLWQ